MRSNGFPKTLEKVELSFKSNTFEPIQALKTDRLLFALRWTTVLVFDV